MKLISFAEANPAAWIELDGGTRIMLSSLQQCLTYAGLLVGLPTPRINEECKADALRVAASQFGTPPDPCLIKPVPVSYTMQTQRSKIKRGGLLEPAGPIDLTTGERLPLVTCIAKFRCPATTKEFEGIGLFAYSTATLVWFQEAFAMPISPEVLAAMRALSWETISADVSD